MVEGASIMHINIVIVLKMLNKEQDIACYRAFSSGIRAIIRAVPEIIVLEMSNKGKEIDSTTCNS